MADILRSIDMEGKTVGQFCCNNGRELLSLVKCGKAAKGIGFDIAENQVAFANEKAKELSLPCTFEAANVYDIDENGNRENAQPASRRFISYVPQGNTLLSGSIAQNLRMGKKNASEEELWEALRMADADTFVMKTEDGLDTRLTEKAGGLSEGQAQRIAIARALIRNKPQLILDEATSALDEDTESRILSRITKSYGKTIFIITHRRSMLRYCNRVIELGDDATATIRDLK